LTCHFLTLAVDVSSLTSSVIELGCTVLLVFAVGLTALFQSRLMAVLIAAVALAAITGAADIENPATSSKSTPSPAYLDGQR
jgi:hypothetical protein